MGLFHRNYRVLDIEERNRAKRLWMIFYLLFC